MAQCHLMLLVLRKRPLFSPDGTVVVNIANSLEMANVEFPSTGMVI